MKKAFVIVFSALVLLSCGGTKNINSSTVEAEDMAAARLIANYYDTTLDFNTLAARLRVKYKDKRNSQTVTVNLRMEKDKTIWLSASLLGISLAKAKVTPDRVAYYEKITRTYFDGDFSFLSRYFGVEMNFEQLQRLLLGQAVYDLRNGKYVVETQPKQYVVTPRKQLDLLNLFFYLQPENFVLKKQQVTQPKDAIQLDVDYVSHQEVGGKPFPETIFINAAKKQDRTTIHIDFRNVDLNADVRFPFKIPNGYKAIKL